MDLEIVSIEPAYSEADAKRRAELFAALSRAHRAFQEKVEPLVKELGDIAARYPASVIVRPKP